MSLISRAANGWLEKWKVRHNIKRVAICGELGGVQDETIESRKERLPEITEWRTYGIWMKLFISGMPCPTKALDKKGKRAEAARNLSSDSQ